MKPRFDRNDPNCGTIYPPYEGASFYLNGHYFDVLGNYLRSDKAVDVFAGETEVAAPVAASQSPEASASRNSASSDDVDFVAWYNGDVKYPFFTVKKAAQQRFPGAEVNNTAAIRAAVEAAGLVG